MKKILCSLLIVMMFPQTFAAIPLEIIPGEKFDIYYIQDERVPKFHITIYMADGTLSEDKRVAGATEAMFQLFSNGTKKFKQEAIASELDQLGMSFGGEAFYESSEVEFGGLLSVRKDITSYACHLLTESVFPADELKKYQTNKITQIRNIISSHDQLVERVTRQLFYAGTDLETPPDGKIKTISKLSSGDLIKQRNYFLNQVKKRVFIQGPKKSLDVVPLLESECGFGASPKIVRSEISKDFKFSKITPQVFFIPIKDANQAQIRFTRVLGRPDFEKGFDQQQLTSSFLGGSFSSLLMQEVRVKKGLTYSIQAQSPTQANYGRSYISTFSRNEGVIETIETTKQVLGDLCAGNFSDEQLENAKKYLMGRQLLSFDDTKSFLSNVTNYYHKGRSVDDMERFPKVISGIKKDEIKLACQMLYASDAMSVAVMGDESLKPIILKYFGKDLVKVVNYQDYL